MRTRWPACQKRGGGRLPLCVLLLVLSVGASASSAVPKQSARARVHDIVLGKDSGPRIVGGFDAQPGQFPYQVSVRRRSQANYHGHFCGGAILNATTVVTAGHCVHRFKTDVEIQQLYIVAGSNLLSKGGVQRKVASVLVHPDYGPVYQDYDVALLYLDEALPLGQNDIEAVKLQEVEGLPSGHPCVASGWGRTVDAPNADLPDNLQAVNLPVVDVETCSQLYMESSDYDPIIETQICAGFEEGKKDACQGDSGGPLVCNGLLTGLVSWGLGCALPGFPGVYSDVAFLVPWIKENVVLDREPTPSDTTADAATASSAQTLRAVCLVAALLFQSLWGE